MLQWTPFIPAEKTKPDDCLVFCFTGFSPRCSLKWKTEKKMSVENASF